MEVVFERRFRREFRALARRYSWLPDEMRAVLEAIVESGDIPASYNPHELVNKGGNYTGHWDFHLSDAETDVVVIYIPLKTNPSIRFVRIGSHGELFGSELR